MMLHINRLRWLRRSIIAADLFIVHHDTDLRRRLVLTAPRQAYCPAMQGRPDPPKRLVE
jgi:hypothetical protein